ncbi:MAG: nuclear transport factor 2 family protein [Acidobacteriota bacterium]|nr:nuclear transport factor 2 family protein [Acidobacteriota bacterium]
MIATTLTPDLVQAEIRRFWAAFLDKRMEELAEFYAPDSSVFSTNSHRAEPGRLAAARRVREYFAPHILLRHSMGLIDVQMLGDAAAVATYSFDFHAERRVQSGMPDEHLIGGRCTQVFGIDAEGTIKIFHEHVSAAI